MRSSCEASATNWRWRASVASVSPRASLSAKSMLSIVIASSDTSSLDSGCGIVSDGSRVRVIARAVSVSRVIGAIARVAVASPASSASAAPPSTPRPRNSRTRSCRASTSEIRRAYWTENVPTLVASGRDSIRYFPNSSVSVRGGGRYGAFAVCAITSPFRNTTRITAFWLAA